MSHNEGYNSDDYFRHLKSFESILVCYASVIESELLILAIAVHVTHTTLIVMSVIQNSINQPSTVT